MEWGIAIHDIGKLWLVKPFSNSNVEPQLISLKYENDSCAARIPALIIILFLIVIIYILSNLKGPLTYDDNFDNSYNLWREVILTNYVAWKSQIVWTKERKKKKLHRLSLFSFLNNKFN